jgi:hypothetical protein
MWEIDHKQAGILGLPTLGLPVLGPVFVPLPLFAVFISAIFSSKKITLSWKKGVARKAPKTEKI